MELLWLRYFQMAARRQHISRAADELGVPQPSISRAIARLESELGVSLFDRVGRQIRLNRFGKAFLQHVDRTLQELDDARRELLDAASAERGTVAVGAETVLTLGPAVNAFMRHNPQVAMRLVQLSGERMAERLRTGEVDLCLASQPLGGPPLTSLEVLHEEVFLVVPAAHRLAGESAVAVAELADEPMVVMQQGYWQRRLTDDLFRSAGLRPRIACEGNEPGATQDLIEAGLGIGLLPAMARAADSRRAVSWLRVDAPGCERRLALVWNEDTYLPAAAERFRDFTRDYFRSGPV